jgi:hypothetical protein
VLGLAVMSRRYWRLVFVRAMRDTKNLAPESPAAIAQWVIGFLVVTGLIYLIFGIGAAVDNAKLVAVGLVGLATTLAIVFLWNLVQAPSRLAEEAANQLGAARAELSRVTAVRLRLTARAQSEIGTFPASASLWVENLDRGEVRNCRARLVGLTSEHRARRIDLDVPLPWQAPDHPSDPTRKTFANGAELLVAGPGTPNYMIPAGLPREIFSNPRIPQFARDLVNVVGIEVTADGVVPIVSWYRLRWWNHILIPGDNGEPDTYYSLRSDQIEFEEAQNE